MLERILHFQKKCDLFDDYVDMAYMFGITIMEEESYIKKIHRETMAIEYMAAYRIQKWWRNIFKEDCGR